MLNSFIVLETQKFEDPDTKWVIQTTKNEDDNIGQNIGSIASKNFYKVLMFMQSSINAYSSFIWNLDQETTLTDFLKATIFTKWNKIRQTH